MDCNSTPAQAAGSPTSKLVYSTLDNHGGDAKGNGRLDKWNKSKRSPLFNMFCWFCFSSSDSDDDKKAEDGVVASMLSAENHFRHVKRPDL